MIRPFTCCCLLLAAGAGLYTYQAKHQSELLDREIARVLKLADLARQRTGVLRAEYTLLNDPSRLSVLVATHLPDLRSTAPTQYTNWVELDRRLPPVGLPASAVPPVTEPPAIEGGIAALPTPAAAPPATPGFGPTGPSTGPSTGAPADGPAIAAAARRMLGGPAGGVGATPIPAALAAPAVEAAVSQAAWTVPLRPPVIVAPLRPPVIVAPPRPELADRAAKPVSAPPMKKKPVVQKVAVASLPAPVRTARLDLVATPVSAPTDAVVQFAQGSGVGRSGLGGMTMSSLGMARANSSADPSAQPR